MKLKLFLKEFYPSLHHSDTIRCVNNVFKRFWDYRPSGTKLVVNINTEDWFWTKDFGRYANKSGNVVFTPEIFEEILTFVLTNSYTNILDIIYVQIFGGPM